MATEACTPPFELSNPGNLPRPSAIPRETLRGGMFLVARYGLGVLISIGNMFVMTWWIGPHAYGLFVTAIGIAAFLASVARAGVDTYLVRCEARPDNTLYGTAASLIVGASLVLTLAAAACIPLLIGWFGNREFVPAFVVLLLAVPLTGLIGVPMAKLERNLDFRSIAMIELAAQAAGLIIAILLAWRGMGVWAPVLGQIGWQLLTLILAYRYAQMNLCLRFNSSLARTMAKYGVGLTVSLRTWQLRTLVSPLIVGHFLGAEAVAFVALAIRIAEALGTFRQAAGRMAIAALARLQGSRDRLSYALQRAVYLQVITLGPLLCGFALFGPTLLPRLLGSRWLPSLAVFPFVAAAVLVNSVYNLQASALFVTGKPWMVTQSFAAHVFLLAAATVILVPRCGIVGYGAAELIACVPYLLIHYALRQDVDLSYRQVIPYLAAFELILFSVPLSHFARRLIA